MPSSGAFGVRQRVLTCNDSFCLRASLDSFPNLPPTRHVTLWDGSLLYCVCTFINVYILTYL